MLELSVAASGLLLAIKRDGKLAKVEPDKSTSDGLDGRSRFLLMKMENKGPSAS
jgi:hypothetical protein